jgi:hypothetical protein
LRDDPISLGLEPASIQLSQTPQPPVDHGMGGHLIDTEE